MEIKIPAVDAVVEAAKGFLEKVITPPLEEVGLLFSDKVKLWRFKNQVNTAIKAEAFLKSSGIKTKKVSLKVLTPLLEYASLEEEESLQEKWVALLANTVSEGSNLETTLFSHILSQLTKRDADVFQIIFNCCTSKFEASGSSVYVFLKGGGRSLDYNTLRQAFDNIELIIDNLKRLRLIEPPGPFGEEMVTLTVIVSI